MPRVIVFDLNETLMDLSALDPAFARTFGDAEVRKKWFKQVLELFLTATVIGEYQSFDKLTEAALEMVAEQEKVALKAADRTAVMTAMKQLPAYPDVRPALERLDAAGFRLAVLSNSTEKSARGLIDQTGLGGFFERILSADAVERYKPAREAYEYAAKELDVRAGDVRLVAAHAWDVAGALKAGCKAGFVARAEKALNPKGAKPDISGAHLREVAEQILKKDA
ncbi:MAG: haloacid dehalogenase type II [Gemmatimonadaceae bacterium]